MKKNKYIVFATIGFELVSLIVFALWLGNYFIKQGYSQNYQAFFVVGAFLLWFISLIIKLKKMKND